MSRYSFYDLLAPKAKELLLNMVARWGYNQQELAENTAYREAAFAKVFIGVNLATYPVELTKLASQNDHELMNDLSIKKTLLDDFHFEKKKLNLITIEIIKMVLEFIAIKMLKDQKAENVPSRSKSLQAEFDHIEHQIIMAIQRQIAEMLAKIEAKIAVYNKEIARISVEIGKLDVAIEKHIKAIEKGINSFAKESLQDVKNFTAFSGMRICEGISVNEVEAFNAEVTKFVVESSAQENLINDKFDEAERLRNTELQAQAAKELESSGKTNGTNFLNEKDKIFRKLAEKDPKLSELSEERKAALSQVNEKLVKDVHKVAKKYGSKASENDAREFTDAHKKNVRKHCSPIIDESVQMHQKVVQRKELKKDKIKVETHLKEAQAGKSEAVASSSKINAKKEAKKEAVKISEKKENKFKP